MNLYEIRKRAGYEANAKQSQKNAVRTWLQSLRADYQFAVTLTIKTSIPVLTERGAHIRRITRRDCDAIAARLIKKLNRQAFRKEPAFSFCCGWFAKFISAKSISNND